MSIDNDQNDTFSILTQNQIQSGKEFDNAVAKTTINVCNNCNKGFPTIKILKGINCSTCSKTTTIKKFTSENNMDPGDVPEELQNLSYIEQMLIARVHPVMSLYRIKGAQYAYSGNVINFQQNIQ